MAQNIEDFLPPIQSAGFNTLKDTSLGGALTVAGTSTFTGVSTFTATPVFNGGRVANVVSQTTGATLTVAQSGSTVLWNATNGLLLTLPPAAAGLDYTFIVATKATTGTHALTTNTSTVFLQGGLVLGQYPGASGNTSATFGADGSTTLSVRMNGGTSGGSTGTVIRLVGISTTQWVISGQALGSGQLATPFTTN